MPPLVPAFTMADGSVAPGYEMPEGWYVPPPQPEPTPNFFAMPMDASPSDRVVGVDELGREVRQTRFGTRYWQEASQPRGSVLSALAEQVQSQPVADTASAVVQALAGGIWDGISAPARAYRGESLTYGDAANTAGMAMLGGAAIPRNQVENLASRRVMAYDLPTRSGVDDGLGRLGSAGVDVEGRPLVARHVVGRAPDRIGDQPLSPEAAAEVVEGLTGRAPEGVASGQLRGGAVGQARFDRLTNQPLGVEFSASLRPEQVVPVVRHELGHVIDEVAGQIPVNGLTRDLGRLYNFGLEGRMRDRNLTLPRHLGYSGAEAPREMVAEALRQYMASPAAMREMFPDVAAWIRASVNANPALSPHVQFNLGGSPVPGVMGVFAGSDQ